MYFTVNTPIQTVIPDRLNREKKYCHPELAPQGCFTCPPMEGFRISIHNGIKLFSLSYFSAEKSIKSSHASEEKARSFQSLIGGMRAPSSTRYAKTNLASLDWRSP